MINVLRKLQTNFTFCCFYSKAMHSPWAAQNCVQFWECSFFRVYYCLLNNVLHKWQKKLHLFRLCSKVICSLIKNLRIITRLQTNRGYKKMNRNTDFWPMIFVSYSRIRIFKIGIRIRMKGIQSLKNIFRKPDNSFQTNRIEFIRK